jgi:hypothetical protein
MQIRISKISESIKNIIQRVNLLISLTIHKLTLRHI